MTDAIKIACDFLSIECLVASGQLVHEFRMQRLVHQWPEDVLQFETSLLHAWNSLCHLRATIPCHAQTLHPTMISTIVRDGTRLENSDLEPAGADAARLLAKRESRQRKRRQRKQRLAVSARPRQSGHDCLCPYCPRFFNKSGLVFHL